MDWGRPLGIVGGTAVVLAITAGFVLAAGTTTVTVQPESATVETGETTTVDIVVESAGDGVGSLDLELAVSNPGVANVSDVTVAGNPSTVRTSGGNDSVRIAATGMDTVDTGSVTVATVTLTGESAGTTSLDLTVAAVGDESGSAYDVTGTTTGELTVDATSDGSDADDGPTAVASAPGETTAGTSVTFNASNSTSETADGIERYEWTFDDGTAANGSVVTHTYDEPGTYRVTLTVTDSNGFDRETTGIVVDAAQDGSQSDDGGSNTDNTTDTGDESGDETTDGTDTGDETTDGTDNDEASGDDEEAGSETGGAGEPITTPVAQTETATSGAAETTTQPQTTTETSTQSPSETATNTDTTATEPSSLQLVPLVVIGVFAALMAGLFYYRRGE